MVDAREVTTAGARRAAIAEPPAAVKTCRHPDGCDKKVKARWLCASHYSTWVSAGRPDLGDGIGNRMLAATVRAYADIKTCSVADCDTKARGRGLCGKHLKRLQRNGHPETREQICAHGNHPWHLDGPGHPSPYCPDHRDLHRDPPREHTDAA